MTEKLSKENLWHDPETGVRAYELDGMRVCFPADWNDEQKQEWFDKARSDFQHRRQLRIIRKEGGGQFLRAFRKHGSRHGEV